MHETCSRNEKYEPALRATNLEAWREWLELNSHTAGCIHLIVYKKKSKVESVGWHDAIEHALCYGWVDSTAHKRDEDSCYLKFTPRNPRSSWGKKNIERAKKMIALGFMREPGFEAIKIAKAAGKWKEP